MNILVTGSGGQLGKEIQAVSRRGRDRYIFTDVCEGYTRMDITSAEDIRSFVKENDVKCIINCAAWTDVEGAENPVKRDKVELLNAVAPGNLAAAMKEAGGLLVHISTDYVFGDDRYNTPRQEDMEGTPSGVYGLTKLQGEQNILASGCNHIIIRTSWMYSEYGKNFVTTMLDLTREKPRLNVVVDQVGTPTYAMDLACAIFKIVDGRLYEGRSGIYNYTNEGVCSWYDFSKAIASLSGHTSCDIRPCHSDEFPSSVRRPSYSVLDKTRIKETFGVEVPYWLDSLRVCLENIKETDRLK